MNSEHCETCYFCNEVKENGFVKVEGEFITLCENCDIDGHKYNGWSELPPCPYKNCYRKCKKHFEEYEHK